MTLTTERPLTEDQRIDQWRFARDVERARADNTREAPTGADDCASSTDGAAFSTEDRHVNDDPEAWWQACVGMIGLIIFCAGMIVAANWLAELPVPLIAAAEPQKPDCRQQWTDDVRYVEHCNFHDGRGYVEVRDE